MDFNRNLWLMLFLAWGLPLGYYRSKFRKLVYQTDRWTINIKPVFWREIKGLFGNLYPENKKYIQFRNFYLFYLLIYVVLFVIYFNTDTMKVVEGSQVPSFELKNQYGELFSSDSVVGKKNLVIYFYPKDDTPGCTKEACSFRDQFAVFADADAMIIGISAQSVESHLAFAKKHRLNYLLLSDTGNQVRKLFGVPGNLFGLIPGRVTYIVDKKGEVIYIFNSQMDAEKHVDEALRILQVMK
ncbi:peroxiredoxin [Bacteroides sp.]|uniref:peroxiredoxin n=1 Tax=Bacteroides sp. TaxID=29523 RepID=UPI001B5F78FE|nr:peroxiredoxin [Bacteroides sp.]MBP6065374.1 peroxiredoxin [Bacteroides sp.]MBP6067546.1 peroxiredoxin [Bacteroides sp.]MBP6936526.1 peroxiredoxin [Bacteroides sp.]MBP8622698.1 peroxiredoxin [Bacteroides sp.]MBP9507923.1 peroxiredoxin [Bacteroides sp.]